jgi:hypothetical protein
MKNQKKEHNQENELPELTGSQFKFIRSEMGITQERFSFEFGRDHNFTSRIETKPNKRVKIKYVQTLRDMDPELFSFAYASLLK